MMRGGKFMGLLFTACSAIIAKREFDEVRRIAVDNIAVIDAALDMVLPFVVGGNTDPATISPFVRNKAVGCMWQIREGAEGSIKDCNRFFENNGFTIDTVQSFAAEAKRNIVEILLSLDLEKARNTTLLTIEAMLSRFTSRLHLIVNSLNTLMFHQFWKFECDPNAHPLWTSGDANVIIENRRIRGLLMVIMTNAMKTSERLANSVFSQEFISPLKNLTSKEQKCHILKTVQDNFKIIQVHNTELIEEIETKSLEQEYDRTRRFIEGFAPPQNDL